jgi:ppGpp synthetase/RelA/SpoT-type nucleotidyltranferase
MKLNEFLEKYNIKKEDFERTKLSWELLLEIKKDHELHFDELDGIGNTITNLMLKFDKVHSVKFRVKNSEHLIEKIIRKTIENPELDCNITNYFEKVTDLIGVRALHLFKEDWINIHNIITAKWETNGKPIAKVRKGDSEIIIEDYLNNNCIIEEHKFGYRSIHYNILTRFYLRTNIVEIQVRTIFEEGWSEIDHHVRYPYDQNNPILLPYLTIFNRLAGSADEMGSYILLLRKIILLCHITPPRTLHGVG